MTRESHSLLVKGASEQGLTLSETLEREIVMKFFGGKKPSGGVTIYARKDQQDVMTWMWCTKHDRPSQKVLERLKSEGWLT